MISTIHYITSFDRPELEPYRTLRRPIEHLEQGIFVAEGEKVILRLLASSLTVHSILLSQDWFDLHQDVITQHPDPIEVFIGEKKLLESIVGHVLHQSIMGIASVPPPLSSDDLIRLLQNVQRPENGRQIIVMVDGVTNAENMGVIVRNCVCFGVEALLVLSTSCDPYLRRSVRNSMGNIFQLPIVYIQRTDEAIRKLKLNGVRFYAAHPHPDSDAVGTTEFAEKSCLVLGAEGHGIAAEVLELCDEFVTIPMNNGADSLNVASASAVMLYEMSSGNK